MSAATLAPQQQQQQPSQGQSMQPNHWKRRVALLHYLHAAHKGNVRWMHVHLVDSHALTDDLEQKQLRKRVDTWYMLGLSLEPIIQCTDALKMAWMLGQLVEEIEYFTNVEEKRSVKSMVAKSIGMRKFLDLSTATLDSDIENSKETDRIALRKLGGHVVYSVLKTGHVTPNGLSYKLVVLTLCTALSSVYEKLASAGPLPVQLAEVTLKADKLFKKLFFGWIGKLIEEQSVTSAIHSLRSPDTIINSWTS